MAKTPDDFGAFGGKVDNHIALQKWLDKGGSLSLNRFYTTSKTLQVKSGTTIEGVGRQICGIECHPSFPVGNYLLLNKTTSLGLKTDVGISFFNFSIAGTELSSLQNTSGIMVAFLGVRDFIFRDMLFKDWRRTLLAFNNCEDGTLDNCLLQNYGTHLPVANPGTCTHEGGAGIWMNETDNIKILNSHIRDGAWTGIELNATANRNLQIKNTLIEDVGEAGIFGGARRAQITGNTIRDVRLLDCSAHGIEFGGYNIDLSGNTFENCDFTNILLTNGVCVSIRNNICKNPNRKGSGHGAIQVRNIPAAADSLLNQVAITDNILCDETENSDYGIVLQESGGGLYQNFQCMRNNLAGTKWRQRPILVGENVISPSVQMDDNLT